MGRFLEGVDRADRRVHVPGAVRVDAHPSRFTDCFFEGEGDGPDSLNVLMKGRTRVCDFHFCCRTAPGVEDLLVRLFGGDHGDRRVDGNTLTKRRGAFFIRMGERCGQPVRRFFGIVVPEGGCFGPAEGAVQEKAVSPVQLSESDVHLQGVDEEVIDGAEDAANGCGQSFEGDASEGRAVILHASIVPEAATRDS